jgi:hypothetical protein
MIFYWDLRRGMLLLKRLGILLSFVLLASYPVLAEAADDANSGAEILDKYFASVAHQSDAMKGMAMDVTLDGRLPKLKKQGRMNVLRAVSRLGQITYKQMAFLGDDTVKKEVIARFLTAEQTAAKETPQNASISADNYNFKFKGLQDKNNRRVAVFELKPKEKRVGLFKGELWLDPETGLPLREAGKFVKNPSIFLKKIEFVREYEIADGTARPKHIESIIDTRIAGKAELAVDFSNYRKQPDTPVDEARATQ